ncbi:MAG: restriction endonuclease [Candidatus Methanospirareceae archaeon]
MREHTKWALQEVVGWQEFEDICIDYLYCQHGYTNIRQAGKTRDGGRDAVALHGKNEAIVFAFSMEQNPLAGQVPNSVESTLSGRISRLRCLFSLATRT